MSPTEFDNRVRAVMAEKRTWFEGTESPVTLDAVNEVESELGCALPSEFKHFATTFGGGYFGGVNVSTFDRESDWYVLSRPAIEIDGKAMLVVSDDDAGGYYGFVFADNGFDPAVIYANPDDGSHREDAASSFFDFIEKFALNV